jgi:hypothetical protein
MPEEENIFALGLFGVGVLSSGGLVQNKNLALVGGIIYLGCFIYGKIKFGDVYWFKRR